MVHTMAYNTAVFKIQLTQIKLLAKNEIKRKMNIVLSHTEVEYIHIYLLTS